jgi:hypothetical protein
VLAGLSVSQPAGQIDTALTAVYAGGRVTRTQILTRGRPAQLWTATSQGTQPAEA